jgi:acyl-CoA dehydrogenase
VISVPLAACWFIPYVNQTATSSLPPYWPSSRAGAAAVHPQAAADRPMMKVFRKVLPPLSQTERIALETGSVGFEGELFTGDPDWNILLNYPSRS